MPPTPSHRPQWLLAALFLGALLAVALWVTGGATGAWATEWEPTVPATASDDDGQSWFEPDGVGATHSAPGAPRAANTPAPTAGRRPVTPAPAATGPKRHPTTPHGHLTGQVRDNLGNPVPDALVHVHPAIPAGQLERNVEAIDEVSTDAGGRFEARVPLGEELTVQAEHHEFAPADPVEHVVVSAGTEELPTLVLRIGRTLRGRVLGVTGHGVSNACVQLQRSSMNPLVAAAVSGRVWETTTGEQGEFTVRGLPEGEFRVQVRPPAPWAVWCQDEVLPSPAELPIQLHRGTEVTGRVVDTTGQALVDAALCLIPDGAGDCLPLRASAARDGQFRFAGVTPGPYRLRASAPGHQAEEKGLLQLGEDPLALETIALRSRPRLRVSIASPESGRPAEARIELLAATPFGALGQTGQLPCTVRLADGQAVLPGPEPGNYALLVTAPPFAPTVSGMFHAVESGGDLEIVVRMQAAAQVLGKALTTGGEPAAKVQVEAWPALPHAEAIPDFLRRATVPEALRPRTLTGEDGTFALTGLGPGRWELILRAAGCLAGPSVPFEVTADKRTLELPVPLRLSQGAVVEGKAVDEDGIPLRGGEVELMPCPPEDATSASTTPTMSRLAAPQTAQRCRTDDEGRFALRGVPPGAYWISTGRRSSRAAMLVYADHERSRQPILLEDGKTRSGVFLQIKRNVTR